VYVTIPIARSKIQVDAVGFILLPSIKTLWISNSGVRIGGLVGRR
jgi:hypothetical protein